MTDRCAHLISPHPVQCGLGAGGGRGTDRDHGRKHQRSETEMSEIHLPSPFDASVEFAHRRWALRLVCRDAFASPGEEAAGGAADRLTAVIVSPPGRGVKMQQFAMLRETCNGLT